MVFWRRLSEVTLNGHCVPWLRVACVTEKPASEIYSFIQAKSTHPWPALPTHSLAIFVVSTTNWTIAARVYYVGRWWPFDLNISLAPITCRQLQQCSFWCGICCGSRRVCNFSRSASSCFIATHFLCGAADGCFGNLPCRPLHVNSIWFRLQGLRHPRARQEARKPNKVHNSAELPMQIARPHPPIEPSRTVIFKPVTNTPPEDNRPPEKPPS
mmetsp:Transcript_37596/g.68525  ORF Transcript_37596/g.68525 Transcript_37596/m.68525 type:complete len:213 (+) Transcript_37596:614-1252(+)